MVNLHHVDSRQIVRLLVFSMQHFVYIHRHATVVKTSCVGVPRLEMPRCSFTFSSLADVRAFWTALQTESLITPAGLLLLMMTFVIAMAGQCKSSSMLAVTDYTGTAFYLLNKNTSNGDIFQFVVWHF